MIKINFIGKKNSGKSLSCFLFGKLLSKKNKTIILNIDLFTKYTDFIKKNAIIKKIKINENNIIKIVQINNNFDWIDFHSLSDLNNKEQLISWITLNYDILLIDQLSSIKSLNANLLNDSNYIICPFKINENVLDYQEKILQFFLSESINFKNFKYLILLSQDDKLNMTNTLKIRKQLSTLLFKNFINHYHFSKYSDLLKNTKLLDEYNLVLNEIKKNLNLK
ncbi:MAG: hypothetical protein K2H56_03505 [Malacoplasma sp.]|nr:hypothetical protein [Malacoplasma sp.]